MRKNILANRNLVRVRKRSRDFCGTIGRGIVHDDDFEINASLRNQRVQTEREASLLVPRRNDDGDDRIAAARHCREYLTFLAIVSNQQKRHPNSRAEDLAKERSYETDKPALT